MPTSSSPRPGRLPRAGAEPAPRDQRPRQAAGRRPDPRRAVPPALRRSARARSCSSPPSNGSVVALLVRRGERRRHPDRTRRPGRLDGPGASSSACPTGGDPLARAAPRPSRLLHTPREPGLPPFVSGMVGYLGYDVVRRLEQLPDSNARRPAAARAGDDARHRPGRARPPHRRGLADRQRDQLRRHRRPASTRPTRTPSPASQAMADAAARSRPSRWSPCRRRRRAPAEVVRQRTAGGVRGRGARPRSRRSAPARRSRSSSASASRCPARPTPLDVYRVLRRTNPSPYLYLLRLDGFAVVGSSPEALVTVDGRRAVTHPIAGTRPRGATAERGRRLRGRAARRPQGDAPST